MTKLFYERISNALLNWPGYGTVRMIFMFVVLAVLYVLGNAPENY